MAKINNESKEKMENMNNGENRRTAFDQLKRDFEKNPNDAAVGLELAKAVSISVINRLTEFCPGKTYGDGGDVYYEAYGAIWEAYAKWGRGSQLGWLDRPVKLKKLKKYTYGSYADADKREYQEVEIVPIVWIYRKVRNYISNQKNPRQAASLADYEFDKETLENYYIKNKMFANINGDLDAFTATVNEWDSKKCEKLLVQILELFRNDSIKTATIKAFANYGNIADAARALGRNWSNVQKTRDIIRNTILKNKILTEKQVKALGISSRYYN